MLLDPQNIGLDNLILDICALLICIKMVCGTFCQLFNLTNRFLWYFSNLETSIRNCFPGVARYPLLPAQLIIYLSEYLYNDWITIFTMMMLHAIIFLVLDLLIKPYVFWYHNKFFYSTFYFNSYRVTRIVLYE